MGKLKSFLERIHTPHWLCFLLLFVFLLRIPSFFESYSYGDETVYLTLGQGVRQGLTLYKEIHDNKPPLLYLIAALAGNLFWFKAILTFWSLATIIFFWKLSKAVFGGDEKLQKVSTLVFAILSTLPLLEGHVANAENFMIGFIVLAFYILFAKGAVFKSLFLSGILFSLATLFKVPAAFDLGAIFAFWIIMISLSKEKILSVARNTFFLLLGFLAPIAVTSAWFWIKGAFNEYLVAAFLQNIGYLSSFRPGDVVKPFLVRNLPLLIRGGVVLVGFLTLLLARKKLSRQFIFVTLWLLTSLFAVTLSERPYPHYLLQAVPPLSFLFGILFTSKNFEQALVIIPLSLAFFVPFYYKFWYYASGPYYMRFLNLISRRVSKETYLKSFGRYVPRNYAISDFLANFTSPRDRVFVWGPDSSNIYALARRLPPVKYVADYHIKDFSSKKAIAEELAVAKPKYIVILPEAEDFTEISPLLNGSYLLTPFLDSAEIWKLRSKMAK